jgi:DNA-binding transcriptional MerR regulator
MEYSIGEFSRITMLSIKSLRLYHEKELLIPARVDEFTSYRYYDEENVDRARAINILKRFDFSLAEIKEILDECEKEEDTLDFLEKKLKEIELKIAHFQKVSQDIELTIQFEREQKMATTEHFEVEEKVLDTILIAGFRMKGRYDEYGKGARIIAKVAGRHINGKAMSLYYDGEYKENDADFEPCFPVRKGTSTDEVSVRELPGGKCVCIIHKGPYESLGDSYHHVYKYIKDNGYEVVLPTREVYLKGPGMIFKGNPTNYLTEIQILIKE